MKVLATGAAARVCQGEDSGQRSDLASCTDRRMDEKVGEWVNGWAGGH